ncbi:MAG: hypothetical protein CVU39_26070 [Chloroflexi bacterium HGW-Chloroflexi-10]|nr:MAG: hypothetical protein CVU39_26070 [Chloroflexi bacterium HGW-Chloroflexi-10]
MGNMQSQISKRPIKTILLFLVSLMLVSCNPETAQTSIPVGTLSTVKFTSTPLPSATPSFSATAFSTKMPILTMTPTLPASLFPELRDPEVRRLMQNDMDCKLPCFLSVIPKKTKFDELESTLYRLGLSPDVYENTVYNIHNYPDSDVPPHTQFFVYNGQVKSIKIDIEQANSFEWSLFSPASILKKYGPPSFVTFGLLHVHDFPPPPWKLWYRMTFYYDDLDFIIQYGEPEIRSGDFITICPNQDTFNYTRIWLGKNPDHPPLQSQDGPSEKVTSLTPEKFQKYLLLGPGACLYLQADAIPYS